jgi:hypothetical protein
LAVVAELAPPAVRSGEVVPSYRARRQFEHLAGVPPLSRLVDREATIAALVAKSHTLKANLAWLVHLTGWTACRAAEIEPMQGGTTAGFEIGLIPHGNRISHKPGGNASRPQTVGASIDLTSVSHRASSASYELARTAVGPHFPQTHPRSLGRDFGPMR